MPVGGIFELYRRVFPAEYFEQLSQQLGIRTGKSIFNWMAVIFGMILQRLSSKGNLHTAVGDLIPVLNKFSDHKRVREQTVSGNPGGFSRARSRMLMTVVEQSFDHLYESLHSEQGCTLEGPTAFLLDGSTLTLEPTPELVQAYPPARNQNGISHWPVMQVVVAHDVRTGLACRPAWAPMFGCHAVGEQQLADQLITRLPGGTAVIADCNFGIFATAYRAYNTGHPVVLRLTKARAEALAGERIKSGTDRRICWKPSAWDLKKHPNLPANAVIKGRLLAKWIREKGKRIRLYLFTSCQDPAEEIFCLYGRRWNIETDLRSLKRTVRLHALSSRTADMVVKELLLAVAAYNLVRTFMQAAAQQTGLQPRDFSFSYAQDCIYAVLPALIRPASPAEINETIQYLLPQLRCCKLPKRKKKRSYPRKIWLRSRSFPTYPTNPGPL